MRPALSPIVPVCAALCGLCLLCFACGPAPTNVERGGRGEIVLEAELDPGLELNGPTPLLILCPKTDVLTCDAEQGVAAASPAKLGFTVSEQAPIGRVKVPVELRFTYCRKADNICVFKDQKETLALEVAESSGSNAVARAPLRVRIK